MVLGMRKTGQIRKKAGRVDNYEIQLMCFFTASLPGGGAKQRHCVWGRGSRAAVGPKHCPANPTVLCYLCSFVPGRTSILQLELSYLSHPGSQSP